MHNPTSDETLVILNQLIPARDQHSIKEAVISFFLANPIVKPEGFQNLINQQLNDFQKFNVLQKVGFQVSGVGSQKVIGKEIPRKNIGFRFDKFENGQISAVLKGETQDELGRTYLSFHDLNYHRWNDFVNKFTKYINILSNYRNDLFTIAFSLHYIDEFYWKGNNSVPIKRIFNSESKFLPPIFFESQNSIYLITTQKEVNGFVYYERLEIKVDENRSEPLITVSHNITQPLNDVVMLVDFMKDENQLSMINRAHSHNKYTLKSIFTPEVCEKINLT